MMKVGPCIRNIEGKIVCTKRFGWLFCCSKESYFTSNRLLQIGLWLELRSLLLCNRNCNEIYKNRLHIMQSRGVCNNRLGTRQKYVFREVIIALNIIGCYSDTNSVSGSDTDTVPNLW